MNIRECYEQFQGDYDEALRRLSSDSLIERFALRFLDDNTMNELRDSLANNDIETAFRAAHTLKGLSGNLSFTLLQQTSSDLTESLRIGPDSADPKLVQAVEDAYVLVCSALSEYQDAH